MTRIHIKTPDDWHLHLREGELLKTVAPLTARQFRRVTAMPNLKTPVTTVALAEDYVKAIKEASGVAGFEPFVPLYLTDTTTAEEIRKAKTSAAVHALKYYPAGATTNSQNGITKFENLYPILEVAEEVDIPFLMHGEVTDPDVDIFDREAVFIDRHLSQIVDKFPRLRMVLEHNSTLEAVQFIARARAGVCGTITPHHLLVNRHDMLGSGIKPHLYCAPIVKSREHQEALVKAALSGSPKFFAGTDSAPHPRHTKESPSGHFGVFCSPNALELYAEVFEQNGKPLEQNENRKIFENFMSVYGARFYAMPENKGTITLEKTAHESIKEIPYADDVLVSMPLGRLLTWKLATPLGVA